MQSFQAMVVQDGKNLVTLNSFEDVRNFLAPRDWGRPLGVARIVCDAQTDKERTDALVQFRKWARVAGILEKDLV